MKKKESIKPLVEIKQLEWSQSVKVLTLRDFNYQWREFCKVGIKTKITTRVDRST